MAIMTIVGALPPTVLWAQGEGLNWTFGDSCGINFTDLEHPRFFETNNCEVEANATISDSSGKLLFYTANMCDKSGMEWRSHVLGANHQPIENGKIAGSTSNCLGNLILPVSGQDSSWMLLLKGFKNFEEGNFAINGIWSYQIDRKNNHQLQVINERLVLKNKDVYVQHLFTPTDKRFAFTNLGEQLAAVKHANGIDWWILVHGYQDTFYKFLLRGSIVESKGVQVIGSKIAPGIDYYIGEMTFSPDGTQFAFLSVQGIIDLYSFDRCTGQLFDYKNLSLLKPGELLGHNNSIAKDRARNPYGCSFSPSGKYLYVSTYDTLYQFDKSANDIKNSKKVISIMPTGLLFAMHELGPDGKIYISLPYSNTSYRNSYLAVIHDPDSLGEACHFEMDGFYLGGKRTRFGLPNMPNYQLGAIPGGVPYSSPLPGGIRPSAPGSRCIWGRLRLRGSVTAGHQQQA